jgi:ketosteroid isomerase-like protein
MRMFRSAIGAALGLTLTLTSQAALASRSDPSSGSKASNKDRAAILELRAEHNRAIASGDAETFLKLAAENYVSIFGGGTIIRSKEELRRVWMERPQQCARSPDRIEIGLVDGQTRAAEHGKWRCDARNPKRAYSGSYFAHWSKTKDGWRVVSDTYVSLACTGKGCDAGT